MPCHRMNESDYLSISIISNVNKIVVKQNNYKHNILLTMCNKLCTYEYRPNCEDKRLQFLPTFIMFLYECFCRYPLGIHNSRFCIYRIIYINSHICIAKTRATVRNHVDFLCFFFNSLWSFLTKCKGQL